MPPVPETASTPSTCSESSRRSVEPKCSCPSNQSPVKPRPSAASRISPKGEANVVVTTSGSFQNSANIIPRTVQTTPADTGGLAITSARLFFPIKRRRRGASTPGRYPRQLSSNTFPRSERVKTKPRSIHTFRPKNRRIRAAKPQEIAVKICQCFGGPNKVVHFTGKVLDLNSHQAQSHPRQQARSAAAAATAPQ